MEVVALVSVGELFTSQKGREGAPLVQVHLHAAVDFEVGFFPVHLSQVVLLGDRTVEHLVVQVEGDNAVVAVDQTVGAEVEVVDVACV